MSRLRALALVVLVASVAFGGAYFARESRRGEAFSRWKADAHAKSEDARLLGMALSRLPAPLPGTPTVGARPDVVMIVLDTVRADRLGVYGYDKGTTPSLDAWAKDARVASMRAPGAWTLPTHASLFTGKLAWEHGAEGTPRDAKATAYTLTADADTLAERLHGAGWQTIGIAANQAFLHRRWGLSQGFQAWLCETLPQDRNKLPYVSADRVVAMARQALSAPRQQPLFLFLNFMDAHAPYLARKGYVREGVTLNPEVLPYRERWSDINQRLLGSGKLDPDVQAAWSEGYDAELRFMDEHLGALLHDLPSLGIGPEDHVIIVADHGEYLGEHANTGHSKDVYEEVLRVPFLWKGPGVAAGRDPEPRQTQQVPGLLLDALGLPAMGTPLPLQVSELYYSRKPDMNHPVYGDRFNRIRRAFARDGKKVIVGDDGSLEAYDLAADPGESRSLKDAPWVAGLRAEGEATLAKLPKATHETVADEPEENAEALKALGYTE